MPRRLVFIAIFGVLPGLCQNLFFGLASNFGPSNSGQLNAITRDAVGAFYAVGQSGGIVPGFTTGGAYQTQHSQQICDQFPQPVIYCTTGTVAKYGARGGVLWATYLGGTSGGHSDTVDKVLLDSHGNVWVSGHAGTPTFPITPNALQPIASSSGLFLAELSPDGSKLLYSTYINGQLLAIDQYDALYLSDLSKFDPSSNQVVYRARSIFSSTGGQGAFIPVAGLVDGEGNFFVAGYGRSSLLTVTRGVYSHPSGGSDFDLALIGIDGNGATIFSTVIGGAGNDLLTAMTRDSAGNFYLTGVQQPVSRPANVGPFTDFPLTPDALWSAWNPAFLLELSPDASTLLYGTFLGKSNVEPQSVAPLQPADLKIGADGKLRVVAVSDQSDLPLSPNAFQPCHGTPNGAFLSQWTYLQFSSDLRTLEYATAIPNLSVGYVNTAGKPSGPTTTNGPFFFDTAGNVYFSRGNGADFGPLDVTQIPSPGPVCLADYVTESATSAAPGLMVSILGPAIGPSQPIQQTLDPSGEVPTQLAGVQVLFGDTPAGILSANPSRIDAIVPLDVPTASRTITISVVRDGNLVGTITSGLSGAAPKLFTTDGSGFGAAAWNQDGTPNSAANPAHVGDVVSFWGTGLGAKSQLGIHFSTLEPGRCEGTYLGDAPRLIFAIFQYNCIIAGVVPARFSIQVNALETDTTVFSPQIYTLYTTQ